MNQEINIYEFVSGDFNDVYERKTIRATPDQMEKYVKDQFNDDPEIQARIEDLGTTDIGYGIYYENEIDPETNEEYEDQELRLEFYVEAVFIDKDDNNETYSIDLDLVNEDIENLFKMVNISEHDLLNYKENE